MVRIDNVKSGNSANKEINRLFQASSDAFDKLIADNTTNRADIASHYDHSPERHRLYINGTRFQLQYNTTPKFEDAQDSYILKPAAGDVMRYQSAERFRYPVGYVISVSQAFSCNKTASQLQGNDKVILGYGNPDLANNRASSDGWFFEWEAGLDDGVVRLTEYRDGTRVANKLVKTEKLLDIWQRLDNRLNWYNVGNSQRIETFTDNGDQINDPIGSTSIDDGKGPVTGNKHITFNVQADAATSDLELECGSMGLLILGEASPLIRSKAAALSGLNHTGSGDWEPLFAVRIDQQNQRRLVNTQLTSIDLNEVSSDVDFQVMAIAIDPSNTDATGFVTPTEHSETNSVVEQTTNVTTFPDSTGTSVTSAANPGGYQIGYASRYTQAQGTANVRRSSTERVRKRNIQNQDVVVFLGKTSSAVDATITYETEQDW